MDKAKIKKISEIVLNVLVWIFVALSVLVTVLVFAAQKSEDGVPALFGTSLISIQTDSMEPIYKPGDLVFMKKISAEDKYNLKEGDIITFRTSVDINKDGKTGDINTHKIYEVVDGTLTFVTKGENNPAPDNVGDNPYTVHHSDIIGVCTPEGKIGGLGGVIDFLRSSLGFFLCIVLPLLLFFLYELYKFIMLLISERAKKAPVVDEKTEEEIKRRAIEEYLKAQAAAESESEKPEPAPADTEDTANEENNSEETVSSSNE